MTNEARNTALYKRMCAEQKRYRGWLLSQPPDTILDQAYRYVIQEDIVTEMEVLDLTNAQAAALMRSKTPLADIYKAWSKTETHHMDDVRDIIENRANDVLHRARQEQERRAER